MVSWFVSSGFCPAAKAFIDSDLSLGSFFFSAFFSAIKLCWLSEKKGIEWLNGFNSGNMLAWSELAFWKRFWCWNRIVLWPYECTLMLSSLNALSTELVSKFILVLFSFFILALLGAYFWVSLGFFWKKTSFF